MSGSGFVDLARAKAAASGASDGSRLARLARGSDADRPSDGGFHSLRAAQAVIRRLRLRAALNDAQASIAAIQDFLNEEVDASRDPMPAAAEGSVGLPESDLEGCIGRLAVDGIEGQDVREKELLQGVNLILQLLDTLGVGLRHGLFSSSEANRSNPPEDGAHRLCGGAK
jgi:hypothetical protein